MNFKILCTLFLLLHINFCSVVHAKATPSDWLESKINLIKANTNIDTNIIRLGLVAYQKALRQGIVNKSILTIIDYSKPSTQKRLWVLDLDNGKALFNTWVSHGKNSGGVKATSFSNNYGSLKTSLGLFVTGDTYFGKNGYSLYLRGLERGINDHAYDRSVVIHGARYVSPDIIRSEGRLGRSWGCPAVSKQLSVPLINAIKGKTLLFAYYPEYHWLKNSRFLTS